MSKSFFCESEFAERQESVRAEMDSLGLDLLVVISPINIMYLVGSALKSYQTFQCLFFPKSNTRTTYLMRRSDAAEAKDHSLADVIRPWGGTRYEDPIDAFSKVLESYNLNNARIGIESPPYYLSVKDHQKMQGILAKKYKVIDTTNLIESIKTVKSPAEIEYIRKAAQIADVGLAAIEKALAPGRTEREVAADAHQAMYRAGGDSPPSPMNFVSGERTCYAHGAPSDRVLKSGDFIHVEFGGSFRRYCSTIARHFSIGVPSDRAQFIHDVTLRASDAALAKMRVGTPSEEPHLAAVAVATEAGLGQYNIHTTGYGIAPGFPPSWGETINMFYGATECLRSGMVLSIEPPIFIHEENIGARLIDCALIEDDGASILSNYGRDIVVV